MRSGRWRSLALVVAMLPGHSVSEVVRQPDTGLDPDTVELGTEILGLVIAAQFRGPALREQVKQMSDAELVAALAAFQPGHQPEKPGSTPADWSLLDRLLANPDALAVMDWLPPDQHAPVTRFYEDWHKTLKVRGDGKDELRMDVEPVDGLFKITIPATEIARYQVVEDRTFGERTLIAPVGTRTTCCQVLSWLFMEETAMAFPSLRLYVEAEWMRAKLMENSRLAQPGSTPEGAD